MIEAKNQTVDLGKLPYGKPHSFTYELVNNSDKQTLIDDLIIGCTACTKATLPKFLLEPNEEVVLNVIFTPGSTGINNKSISLRYGKNILKLKFKAIVN